MYNFLWWWMFALLPVPWLVRYWLKPAQVEVGVALRVPFLDDFRQDTPLGVQAWAARLALLLGVLAWLALVAAAARPVWIGDTVALPVAGRDLMMAIDLSGSMQEQDYILNGRPVDRLTAIKSVATEFIHKRVGDRLGLILFADQAYVQVPLTFDHQTVERLLDEAAIGLAGERTAIGDAIGLAIKRLQSSPEKNRVLILLTDGANTAGTVSPMDAAELAASIGLKIYTVGVGSQGGAGSGVFGFPLMNPSSDLDEHALTEIAEKTGGKYFRASNTEEFQRIYTELDRLEPVEKSAEHWRPQQELFRWPLLAALIFALVAAVLKSDPE